MIFLRKYSAFLPVLLLFLFACSHQKLAPGGIDKGLLVSGREGVSLVNQYAPVFQTDGSLNSYDKIGRPSAKIEKNGKTKVYVDTKRPTIYFMERTFRTNKDNYINLIYRVHFSKTPYRLLPFHLTAGKNVGLMVIITVDSLERPVLVTTVHTCGCYLAIIPTTYLPQGSFPVNWRQRPLRVYGEKLPWILDCENLERPKLLIRLRSGVHRVMGLEIREQGRLQEENMAIETAELIPMSELEKLSLNGDTISFYYDKGMRKGYVKGAIKPWETLFMSLISLDFFVGTDKAYADTEETGNTFYTSLKPWNRRKSNMWNFKPFLTFWGWRL